ncbi:MAG TPA: DUF3568 family protein [Sedimentisphaerales bacterium]|nr:DUF3568 family protein [Sedimentisphaerales bacterium]
MNKNSIIFLITLSIAAMLLPGCNAQNTGQDIDTIAYVAGSFKTTETRNFPEVHTATIQALQDLHWTITKETKDAVSTRIIARDDLDKKLKVNLDGTPNGTTEIEIRYGTAGHEAKSQEVYDQIAKNLQEL